MKKTNDTFMHIVTAMAKVQDSQTNPFKLNEIVTLEKCLQELSMQDPLVNSIIRCLATDCSILEPTKKRQHLSRSKQEIQDDNEFKRRASEMNDQIALINYENAFYQTKLEDLIRGEEELRVEIFKRKKSIAAVDNIYKLLFNEFNLLVERVYSSFGYSLPIVDSSIPYFIKSIASSRLVEQTEMLEKNYRRFLLKLIKSIEVKPSMTMADLANIGDNFRLIAMKHLEGYTKALLNLYKDLTSIDQLYSNEVPGELDYLPTIEGHMEYLERPIQEPPKWTSYRYQNLYEICGLGDEETAAAVATNTKQLPECVAKNQNLITLDPEISRLFNSIKKLWRR